MERKTHVISISKFGLGFRARFDLPLTVNDGGAKSQPEI